MLRLMTEEWRPTHHPDYDVSNLGRVRSRAQGRLRLLRIHPDRGGYLRVRIADVTHRVHRLVAAAFLGPCPKGQECCHKNDDKNDARAVNLHYATHRENVQQCVQRGRRVYRSGEANGFSSLTASDVAQIRALREGLFLRELAALFGVSMSAISRVALGHTWAGEP